MSSNIRALTVKEFADRLTELDSVAVATHIRPDGDTVGTSVAMCRILEALGKDAVLLPADDIPERLRFLTDGVKIADSADGRSVVTCDVASPSQLGELYERLPEIALSLDHHAVSKPFAPNLTIGDLSSAGEVLYLVLCELIANGKAALTPEIAYPLYAAISSDTGGFMYSSATPDTYRAAAALMECGIDYADINHRLFNSKSENQIKAEGFVAANMQTDGNLSYAVITASDRERLGITPEHFETAIDVVRARLGTEIAFVLKELDGGKYRVSLRSTGFNVAEIAEKFSGGGHVRAAGCTVMAEAPEIAIDMIKDAIKQKG